MPLPNPIAMSDIERTDLLAALLCLVSEARGHATYDCTRLKTIYDRFKIPQDVRDAWDTLLDEANTRAKEAGHGTLYHALKAQCPELCG